MCNKTNKARIMIFEYALPIMIFLVLINWRGDGRNVACIFLLTSIVFNWVIGTSDGVEAYVLYSFNEMSLFVLLHISNGPKSLVKDMRKLSILSIVVQLSGVLMWMVYLESTAYLILCEMIFILQIIRLAAHGLDRREASNTQCGSMDSLYTRNSDKKL